jgi:hypothetical protein
LSGPNAELLQQSIPILIRGVMIADPHPGVVIRVLLNDVVGLLSCNTAAAMPLTNGVQQLSGDTGIDSGAARLQGTAS